MFSANRNDGYPNRHQQVVRTTRLRGIGCTVATFLLAAITGTATLYSRFPPLCTAAAIAVFVVFGVISSLCAMVEVRTVRVLPYFQRTVGEIDTFLAGEAIARHLRHLDDLAERLGSTPLSRFGFHDDLMGEELRWYSAADGLRTVNALLDHLPAGSSSIDPVEPVLADLRKLRHALERAQAQGIAFCLLLRHGNTTSGHEWSVRKGTAF